MPSDVKGRPTSGEIPLVVVESVGGVRRPVVMVSGGEVVLNEARPKASKVVRRRRGLVEGRRLLVRRERSSEVRRSLVDTTSIKQSVINASINQSSLVWTRRGKTVGLVTSPQLTPLHGEPGVCCELLPACVEGRAAPSGPTAAAPVGSPTAVAARTSSKTGVLGQTHPDRSKGLRPPPWADPRSSSPALSGRSTSHHGCSRGGTEVGAGWGQMEA